ncbi:MAG: hypothetical protein ACKVIK_15825 [Rhodospirillales bacterium]|jgi:TPR repeat protein
MSQNGVVTPQNTDDAIKWWRRAAKQEDANAQFNLRYAYEGGCGVEQNFAQVLSLYTHSTNEDFGDA